MFHAAWPASHHPAFNPTRGSGEGAVPETIGAIGLGIVLGGIGGGGGGVPPRPPRPPAAAAAGAPSGCAAGGCAGAAAGGCAAGGGAAGIGAAAGADGVVAGGGAVFDEPPHAASPAAMTTAVMNPVSCLME